jgi:predicted nucleotidyltransferase
MFTPIDRDIVRDALIAMAHEDPRITAAALTGSAALGGGDEWSDVDLALSVVGGVDRGAVSEWTERMYERFEAVHHVDLPVGSALFRVFLLKNTLQVDLGFWPEDEFGAIAPSFRLLFGRAHDRPMIPPPSFEALAGMAWLYALHARSSIARGLAWQAEYMISGVRDHVLSLACLRHGLPAVQARKVDQLPPGATTRLAEAIVRSLDGQELRRAFAAVCDCLLHEIGVVDTDLSSRLSAPVGNLVGSVTRRSGSDLVSE